MTQTSMRLAAVCLLTCFVAACQHTNERLVLSSKPALELRAMQSRAFDTPDQIKMLRTIVATLQDLGYKIDKVDPGAGSVSATKLSALRVSASVYPRGASQLIVRSNAQVKMNQQSQSQMIESQVDDPEFYQKFFFEPLSKAIFLTALQVEDEPNEASPDPGEPKPDRSGEPALTP